MDDVKREADERGVKLIVLPTAEAIEVLQKECGRTNAILPSPPPRRTRRAAASARSGPACGGSTRPTLPAVAPSLGRPHPVRQHGRAVVTDLEESARHHPALRLAAGLAHTHVPSASPRIKDTAPRSCFLLGGRRTPDAVHRTLARPELRHHAPVHGHAAAIAASLANDRRVTRVRVVRADPGEGLRLGEHREEAENSRDQDRRGDNRSKSEQALHDRPPFLRDSSSIAGSRAPEQPRSIEGSVPTDQEPLFTLGYEGRTLEEVIRGDAVRPEGRLPTLAETLFRPC